MVGGLQKGIFWVDFHGYFRAIKIASFARNLQATLLPGWEDSPSLHPYPQGQTAPHPQEYSPQI